MSGAFNQKNTRFGTMEPKESGVLGAIAITMKRAVVAGESFDDTMLKHPDWIEMLDYAKAQYDKYLEVYKNSSQSNGKQEEQFQGVPRRTENWKLFDMGNVRVYIHRNLLEIPVNNERLLELEAFRQKFEPLSHLSDQQIMALSVMFPSK